MEHSPEEDINPYRAYRRANLIWGLPMFIIDLLLILFLCPVLGVDISVLLGGCILLFEICFSIFSIDCGANLAGLLYSRLFCRLYR